MEQEFKPTNTNKLIGESGEKAAVKWLRAEGYLMHALNWRSGRYEIDIVAEKWGVIHFIEVKTRKADGWTTPEQAMTHRKVASFRRAVHDYIKQYRVRQEVQMDFIAVDMYPDSSVEVRFFEGGM